jgi:hypothetical protein
VTAPVRSIASRPEAHDSEAQLLGAFLIDAPAAVPLLDDLDPSDFDGRGYRQVFEAIRSVRAQNGVVDQLLVVEEMRRRGTIDRLRGGAIGVHDLVSGLLAPAAAQAHAARVLDAARARRIMRVVGDAMESGDWISTAEPLAALAVPTTAEKPATSWTPVDLAAAFDAEPERPTMLVRTDGAALFYPGRLHAVFSEPEAGKSWLVLAAAAERLALGERVVYLDFEDSPAAIVRRLLGLGVERDRIESGFVYVSPTDPLSATARRDLDAALADGCSLAVVDGVTEAMVGAGLDPDKNADVARWMRDLPAILAATGAAVVLVDHVAKDRTTRGRWAIGGQHKLATIDVAYSLDVLRPFAPGQTGTAKITISKDKIGGVRAAAAGGRVAGEFVLVSEGDDVRAEIRPVEFTAESSDDLPPAARRVLEALPPEPPGVTVRQIGDRLADDGLPLRERTIQKAIAKLEAAGLADAIRPGDGLPASSWRTDEGKDG